ncbi:MAG: tetratricopeptide repeat protein, partial [Alphaproteobacteria bacterium]|nr:tetratricopeptide repeat protein [Alphaproteobacteria bacterium]
RLDEARAAFERLLASHPNNLGLIGNIGIIAWEQGDLADALHYLTRAVVLDPRNPLRLRHLGTVLLDAKTYELAAEAFRHAVALDPSDALAHHGLGSALRNLEKWDEADAVLRQALALAPALPDAHDELALVHIGRGEFAAAEERLAEALRLDPNAGTTWRNLGSLLMKCNRPGEAEEAFRRAVALVPDEADFHTDLGMALLQQGVFAEGWREYDQRWDGSILGPFRRPASLPRWDGAPTPRTLLLHAEQGFGDTLEFSRDAPLVAARGHDIVLEVEAELAELLRNSFGHASIQVVGRTAGYPDITGLPPVEAHCPLMSLPGIFETTMETVPSEPYLKADPAKATLWAERLGASRNTLRVGIVWAGNPRRGAAFATREADARRSMRLAELAPLLAMPDISFVSLQKGEGAAELHGAGFGSVYDAAPLLDNFADTAALIATLDLVISVDTSVVHLAGGMGKPVWMMSRFDGCWRWLLDRADSPWYPSLQIFRQGPDRSWRPVVAQLRERLAERAARARNGATARF